jgi:hypothetical protein
LSHRCSPFPNLLFLSLQRYEKRHSTLSAHCSPAFRVEEGDQVTVGQCRPLSKTIKFNVIKGQSHGADDKRADGGRGAIWDAAAQAFDRSEFRMLTLAIFLFLSFSRLDNHRR